jgi:acyl-CoA synthetase (AMP-forming)/AMP-acid ligase II
MFDTQASEIQLAYDLQPGGVDLACFALFGLFNSTMGVTTIFPGMDFSRPAAADPAKLLAAANDWKVTQAFASPAVWDKLSRQCEGSGKSIPTLRKVFSCGAPVPARVLERTLKVVHPEAEMHTPYGATEALPVATIEAGEVLQETAARTREGAGVCVGRKFDTLDWRIIRITDDPITTIGDAEELPSSEIGELIVRGPQVSTQYVIAPDNANHVSKIRDGGIIWHRMGDVGYLDLAGRFWYCGRKSHRVETSAGTLFTECIEKVWESHPKIKHSALVGIGARGDQAPVICLVSRDPLRRSSAFHGLQPVEPDNEIREMLDKMLIEASVFLPSFPVDVRHNSKVLRELLHDWACGAIIDDFDLFPPSLVKKVLSSRDRLSKPPPFAVIN